jgi:hypothetical protein
LASVTAPDLEEYPGYHEDDQEYYDVEYYLLGCHVLVWDVEVYIFDGWVVAKRRTVTSDQRVNYRKRGG